MEQLLLTVPEAARVLRIGRSKVYELCKEGKIATIHIGRSLRISRHALYAYAGINPRPPEVSATDQKNQERTASLPTPLSGSQMASLLSTYVP